MSYKSRKADQDEINAYLVKHDYKGEINNVYADWTEKDDRLLRKAIAAQWSSQKIAKSLRRTPTAILFRIKKLGLHDSLND